LIIIALIYNLSVLVAISVLSGFIDARFKRTELNGKIFQGILFGTTSIIGMLYPFVLTEGIIFDGRSIVLSLCTLFFGPLAGAIAALMALVYRNALGGGGALMGTLVISESFLIGLYFYYRRKKNPEKKLTKKQLYLMGLIVHTIMLLLVLSLPSKSIAETYKVIGITVIGIYPIVTIIIGKILLDQEQNLEYVDKITQSEELFRTTLLSIGEAVIITDINGRIKKMNFLAENLTEWNYQEAAGKMLDEVFFVKEPNSDFNINMSLNDVIVQGKIVTLSNSAYLISKSKKEIPVSINLAPIKNEKQKITGIVLVFMDITERRKWEDDLLIYSQAFQQSYASIMITGTSGNIEYVNPKFTEMTGYAPEEILGKNPRILQVADNDFDNFKKLERIIVNGQDWCGEVLNRRKDGTYFWVSASISPIKNSNGKITHYISVKEDITAKKELELELKKALDRSEESDRLKSSLLANMSHEFRTPMTGILGVADILNEMVTNPKQKEMVDWIIISGKRLMNTLDAVLEIADLESNYSERKKDLIKLTDVANKVFVENLKKAKDKNIELILVNNDENLFIRSTEKNIRHILANLLDNGIKFTEAGKVQLIIKSEVINNELLACIQVIDTGIGIDEKYLPVVFEEFRQVSEGFSRSHEGSGLGLSVVRKIVNLLNGQVSVESRVNIGSTFTVCLPAEYGKLDSEPEAIKPVVKEIVPERMQSIPEVLLVEDNLVNREVTKTFLRNICSVDHAFDGLTALEMVNKKIYSLILMDINLGPDMDGAETTRKIRKLEEYADIPIIAITGYSMDSDKEKLYKAGLDFILTKPFEKKDLTELIKSILMKQGFIFS